MGDTIIIRKINFNVKDPRPEIKERFDEFVRNGNSVPLKPIQFQDKNTETSRNGTVPAEPNEGISNYGTNVKATYGHNRDKFGSTSPDPLSKIRKETVKIRNELDSLDKIPKDTPTWRKYLDRINKLKLALDDIDVDTSPTVLEDRREGIKELYEIYEILTSKTLM